MASRHSQLWRMMAAVAKGAVPFDGDRYNLVKEWAKAFLEEKGDLAIANVSGKMVLVSELARNPEKHPDVVEVLFKWAASG